MGAWGHNTFDNDDACDFVYDMEKVDDLSPVERAFTRIEREAEFPYLASEEMALAACEVLARLKGNPGYHNAYTEDVDAWVAAHPIEPPTPLVERGLAIIERVLHGESDLRARWEEVEDAEPWIAAVKDLQARLTTST